MHVEVRSEYVAVEGAEVYYETIASRRFWDQENFGDEAWLMRNFVYGTF